MALRNQPYIPLYVQDFMTDEKLSECSAQSTGVYIRIMCLMHKNETYGKILLKQKHKQTSNQIKNFASMVAKNLPYTETVVLASLQELIDENVLHIEGDFLVQRRMVKDNEISEKRAKSGKNGGKKTQSKNQNFALAKVEANSEIEIEDVIEVESISDLSKTEIQNTIQYLKITGQIDLTEPDVGKYWDAFLIHAEGQKHTKRADQIQHFRNWLKKQQHGSRTTKNNAKLGTSEARMEALKRW